MSVIRSWKLLWTLLPEWQSFLLRLYQQRLEKEQENLGKMDSPVPRASKRNIFSGYGYDTERALWCSQSCPSVDHFRWLRLLPKNLKEHLLLYSQCLGTATVCILPSKILQLFFWPKANNQLVRSTAITKNAFLQRFSVVLLSCGCWLSWSTLLVVLVVLTPYPEVSPCLNPSVCLA